MLERSPSHISVGYLTAFITAIFMAILLVLLCIKINSEVAIKPDTLLLVAGNFAIAYWISSIINKKHKNNELKISNCFDELDSLLVLINRLRETIKNEEFDDDYSLRSMSLINLQIDLIKQYPFIEDENTNTLFNEYEKLNTYLTGSTNIDDNYKHALLALEKRILVIKSQIL